MPCRSYGFPTSSISRSGLDDKAFMFPALNARVYTLTVHLKVQRSLFDPPVPHFPLLMQLDELPADA